MRNQSALILFLLALACAGRSGGGGTIPGLSTAPTPDDPAPEADPGSQPEPPFEPFLMLNLQGGSSTTVPISFTTTPSGNFSYLGSTVIEEQQVGGPTLSHTVTWNFVVPSGNDGGSNELLFNGNLSVTASADATGPKEFELEIAFPVPAIYPNLDLGGSGTVALNANADGGELQCASGGSDNSLLSLMADGETAFQLVFCPFLMSMTGSGNASTPMLLENVTQTQANASALITVGLKLKVQISPGEKVTVTIAPVAK